MVGDEEYRVSRPLFILWVKSEATEGAKYLEHHIRRKTWNNSYTNPSANMAKKDKTFFQIKDLCPATINTEHGKLHDLIHKDLADFI